MSLVGSSGLILDVAGQVGGPMPSVTQLVDSSRMHNNSDQWTNVTWEQLYSGQWTLKFNGASQIRIPITLANCLNGFEQTTMLAWVKRTVIGPDNSDILFINNGALVSRSTLLSPGTTGEIRSYSRSVNEASVSMATVGTPSLTEWAFWGFKVNLLAQTGSIYYNTTVRDYVGLAFSNSSYQKSNSGLAWLGSQGFASYLTGYAARIRVLTRALTDDEIAKIYIREKPLFGL